ncbi:hypothetical protein LLQ54_10165 [Rouxiella badensis]|uniref:hypothetical protein n=1 Tax=Rouxiella badensis TaxID=1646377 RepID=UPI001D1513C0|nr:hypothetical protein [Rouxiella badensis]MCC3740246.1 hypothetical protein [Rouxiella badensis]
MKKTYQQLTIEELMRDRTPRSSSQIEAALIENTGFIPPRHSMSSTINTISKKPQFNIVTGYCAGKKTYFLSETPKAVTAPAADKTVVRPVKTKAEISAEFERNLWAVRQGRGQA